MNICDYCWHRIEQEPNVGWVTTASGDQGGTYDVCHNNPDGHVPAKLITLELEIENHYPEDGDVITTHVTAEVPEPPDGDVEDSDWSWDFICEHTGTGREEGNSAYFVEVKKSSNESLIPVGTEWEFGT